jgi:hypothetical protein
MKASGELLSSAWRATACCFLWALPLLLASCSGTNAIEGQVSQWSDPPPNAHSFILVDSNAFPQPMRMSDLDQARISLSEFPAPASPGARSTATSGAKGLFVLSAPNAPFRSDLVISAEHAGCEGARQPFHHLGWFPRHEVTVVLVCRGLASK